MQSAAATVMLIYLRAASDKQRYNAIRIHANLPLADDVSSRAALESDAGVDGSAVPKDWLVAPERRFQRNQAFAFKI